MLNTQKEIPLAVDRAKGEREWVTILHPGWSSSTCGKTQYLHVAITTTFPPSLMLCNTDCIFQCSRSIPALDSMHAPVFRLDNLVVLHSQYKLYQSPILCINPRRTAQLVSSVVGLGLVEKYTNDKESG